MDGEVIAGLRARGVDILTAAEAGMLKRDDEEQLAFASARSRPLYSFNIGRFFQLHVQWSTTGRDHAGLILAKQKRYSSREQIRRLSSLFETVSADQMRNRVEFLSGW